MLRNNGRHNFRSPFGIQPSLVLDFAGTGTLDPRVTFTRSTTGTYYNSSGVLSTAAIDAPRFDYNPSTLAPLGLLIEQSSTNLLTYSQTIDTTNWTAYNAGNGTTTIDTISPDGTTSASTINDTSVLGYYGVNKSLSISTSTNYTFSCYVKQGTSTSGFSVWLIGSAGAIFQNTIAWTAGVPTATGWTATSVGNGYYRISYSFNSSTSTSLTVYLLGAIQNITATGSTIYYGAQLEALAFATSYIPTTSAQVTRAADNASMTGTNFSSWYNTAQSTWFSQSISKYGLGINRVIGTPTSYKAPIVIDVGRGEMYDSTTIVRTANSVTANAVAKIATTWDGTTGQVSLNGGTVASGSQSTGYANITGIGIGYNSSANDGYLNGWIAKISYYPQALTSSQIQSLTGS